MNNRWSRKGFKHTKFYVEDYKLCSVEDNVDDGIDYFSDISISEMEPEDFRPSSLNAFDIISMS